MLIVGGLVAILIAVGVGMFILMKIVLIVALTLIAALYLSVYLVLYYCLGEQNGGIAALGAFLIGTAVLIFYAQYLKASERKEQMRLEALRQKEEAEVRKQKELARRNAGPVKRWLLELID